MKPNLNFHWVQTMWKHDIYGNLSLEKFGPQHNIAFHLSNLEVSAYPPTLAAPPCEKKSCAKIANPFSSKQLIFHGFDNNFLKLCISSAWHLARKWLAGSRLIDVCYKSRNRANLIHSKNTDTNATLGVIYMISSCSFIFQIILPK